MAVPAAGPAHERLAALEGDWMGEEVLASGGGKARGRYRFGTAIDGLYLLGDYQQDRGAGVDFRAHTVLGWDAAAERYVMWWFDSAGAVPPEPARGTWEDGTLTLERSGSTGASRYAFTVGSERLRVRIDHSADGTVWSPLLEATYARA